MSGEPTFDLLNTPIAGTFLRWRHSRTFVRTILLIAALAMIVHGLFGPPLAPKNLATTLSWVHFRGVLILVLLCAGNFFCFSCPFMLVRDWSRRVLRPVLNWPRPLRNKWLSISLLVAVLFSYELFDLWSSPWWTAWLIVAYFATALAVDSIFRHASFCKYVCPIGQFNFVASLVSPLEVKVREQSTCSACATKDCIKGRYTAPPVRLAQRGCELALFQPLKTGNMDCTFCLDCVQACPHDNVGIISRPVASELMTDPRRSGIGRFSRRKDIAALIVVFTFGALLNAFGMISPVYALEAWLSRLLHTTHEAPVLALIFGLFLIVEPVLLFGLAAAAMKSAGGTRSSIPDLGVRYTYGLVPLAFGMWLAHYGFHFLTGMLTVIPLVQSATGFLGAPQWRLTGLPIHFVQPLELGFLVLGLTGSLILTRRLAEEDSPAHPLRAFVPWAAVCIVIWCAAVWLVLQPMDMRGTFLAG